MNTPTILTESDARRFRSDGFLIARNMLSAEYRRAVLEVAYRDVAAGFGDVEYEADLNYPGAPDSREATGGRTTRRLRQAFSRDPVFAKLVHEPFLAESLAQLLGNRPVVMPLAHHNCIMTKHPRFSSDTGWHQDIRYWSFTDSNLVSTWFALGPETLQNGCLQLIPGSHQLQLDRGRFDDELFFREELQENQSLIRSAVSAELNPGDVLFFHARCLHAATRNYSDETKYALVFTFRAADNSPRAGSRSAALPEVLI